MADNTTKTVSSPVADPIGTNDPRRPSSAPLSDPHERLEDPIEADTPPTEARSRGYQGVVCGHIHRPEMREIEGTLYCNDGDWVESLSALVEHMDGRLELVHWAPGALPEAITHGENARAQTIIGA